MFEQKDAILKLLRDDDPQTVSLVKQQLATRGLAAVPGLEDLLAIDDETVTRHAREVLAEIDAMQAADQFTRLCPNFPDTGDLEMANWLIARSLSPGVDVAGAKRQLDQWGRRLRTIVAGISSAEARVRLMASFTGEQLGFTGNSEDYYNAENSLLPFVIESRFGIPISLSLVYICLGERAGLAIEGVNFPGHFLVRHEKILFDPFERGRVLTQRDCEAILKRQNLPLSEANFVTASPRIMLRRMLANLLYVFQNENEKGRAAQIADWIRALDRK
jgi:regulator of sirC expression with transglutaminase-like and TPR domain